MSGAVLPPFTSDYIVRGISRSNAQAALQLDLHYLGSNGFRRRGVCLQVAHRSRPIERCGAQRLCGVSLGPRAATGTVKVLASHYAYPWNRAGSGYDYDELDVDLTYQEWLGVDLVYSPNAPRFVRSRGLLGVSSESAEVNLQRPVLGRLSATAGIGYSHFDGPYAGGFAYWSVGAAYTIAAVSLVVSYVDTTAGAKALFYDSAAAGRWAGTVIWRF